MQMKHHLGLRAVPEPTDIDSDWINYGEVFKPAENQTFYDYERDLLIRSYNRTWTNDLKENPLQIYNCSRVNNKLVSMADN